MLVVRQHGPENSPFWRKDPKVGLQEAWIARNKQLPEMFGKQGSCATGQHPIYHLEMGRRCISEGMCFRRQRIQTLLTAFLLLFRCSEREGRQ